MVANSGKSVRLFLVDGTPGGLVTAEIMNWTGHLLAGPRSDLPALLRREEARRTGVYLLLGDAPDSVGGLQVYIGEGDDISTRLTSHAREKDFWERAVLLTSKDANLTKAHARYLESRFLQIARTAQRSELQNGTAPPLIALPEGDISDMEYFISQALIALPVLGVNVLRGPAVTTAIAEAVIDTSSPKEAEVRFVLANRNDNRIAYATEVDGEFTVLAGSQVRQKQNGNGSYVTLRERLERDGTIDASTDPAVFTKNQVFASPSAAAAIVAGRSANGRTAWTEEISGLSYGAWQNRDLEDFSHE
ncbi:GIY-YIG nuclease family protein [Frigoribacterium sp. MCBA15_019]|uniref:GIY-YIG nuclease family protein n=1 Tax=Frigoribacterium sp. MCBA15_019 TaxID=1898745 RepID=UPI001C43470B|nr:GIY-YIG nuclease family protein [Frigoribacterium sp. MCBA15_019]